MPPRVFHHLQADQAATVVESDTDQARLLSALACPDSLMLRIRLRQASTLLRSCHQMRLTPYL